MAVNLQVRSLKSQDDAARKIETWLQGQPEFAGSDPNLLNISHIDGSGSSNETLNGWLDLRNGQEKRRVALRLLTPDAAPYLDKRLDRQVAVTRWVEAHTTVPVPNILAADLTGEAIGRPFLLMDFIEGNAAQDFPGYNAEGFLTTMAPKDRHVLWTNAVKALAKLHTVDFSSLDFLDFPDTERAELPDLVSHWEASLDWVGDALTDPFFRHVIDHLKATIPASPPRGFSWGDARIGNMLFRDTEVVAILDWEMSSCGGPLIDLAWWLLFDRIQDEDLGVERLQGLGTREETIALWETLTGLSAQDIEWHEILANFQLSVTRAKAFHDRKRIGMAVPDDNDPRSVLRLKRRLEKLLG